MYHFHTIEIIYHRKVQNNNSNNNKLYSKYLIISVKKYNIFMYFNKRKYG